MSCPLRAPSIRQGLRRQQGLSLLEVLMAILVMSIGVLGVAGMLTSSKQGNLDALQRSLAAQYATSLIERMRANPLALATYTNNGSGQTITAGPSTWNSCASDCTREQLAQFDLDQVISTVFGAGELAGSAPTGGLLDPSICVSGPAGGNGLYSVAIAWRSMRRMSNPTSNACGADLGRYGTGADADLFRQVLAITTYIGEPL